MAFKRTVAKLSRERAKFQFPEAHMTFTAASWPTSAAKGPISVRHVLVTQGSTSTVSIMATRELVAREGEAQQRTDVCDGAIRPHTLEAIRAILRCDQRSFVAPLNRYRQSTAMSDRESWRPHGTYAATAGTREGAASGGS
jgi:hypothetical protein